MSVTLAERENLAERIEAKLVEGGKSRSEARRLARKEAGLPAESKPPAVSQPSSGSGSRRQRSSSKRSPSRSSKRRRSGGRSRIQVPVGRAGSAGALFAWSLGLVAMYWTLRNAQTFAQLVDMGRRAFVWIVSTEGI